MRRRPDLLDQLPEHRGGQIDSAPGYRANRRKQPIGVRLIAGEHRANTGCEQGKDGMRVEPGHDKNDRRPVAGQLAQPPLGASVNRVQDEHRDDRTAVGALHHVDVAG